LGKPIQQEDAMGKYYGPKYGKRAYRNIKWKYNFDPLRKWVTILFSLILIAGSVFFFRQGKIDEKQPIESISKLENKQSEEKNNELKALQGILRGVQENQSRPLQAVHVWNENGKIRASNTTYPVKNITVRTIEEVASSATETKYIKQGNSILLPVIVGHNGKAIQVNMMLDTGCSITLIDAEISNTLNIQQKGTIQTTIADGSKMISKTGQVDFFQVGPYKEIGFLVNTRPIMGNQKTQHGLLGMNFLEKHPFTIDHRRQMILWR